MQRLGDQLAFLDHVMAVVDPDTATAIAESDALSHHGRVDVTTVESDGVSWTGRYLVGRRHYVEIFAPGDFAGAEPGQTGLGLSTRTRGDLAAIVERATANGTMLTTGQRTRGVEERAVPWFDYAEPVTPNDAFEIWVMEYLDDPDNRQRREQDFVAWTAAREIPHAPSIDAVTEVDLRIPEGDAEPAAQLLQSVGLRIERSADLVLARDMDITLRLEIVPPTNVGVRRVTFSLDAPASRNTQRIGRSTLTVGPGAQAAWVFASKGG
jgi:hypothetical protein